MTNFKLVFYCLFCFLLALSAKAGNIPKDTSVISNYKKLVYQDKLNRAKSAKLNFVPILSTITPLPPRRKTPCEMFNEFNNLVHTGLLDEYHGKEQLRYLIPLIETYYYAKGGINYAQEGWVFPVQNYNKNAIGGHGSGFKSGGYNYFTRQVAHPAHDIFMNDNDQDEIDDRTLQPVNVLSISGGIVVAAEPFWDSYGTRKGGIYLWIFDPATKRLFYYAHNRNLCVGLGDLVKPGQIISQMGRTGFNANKFRSPTHLHTSCHLVSEDGSVTAYNFYTDLCNAQPMYGQGGGCW